jgi:hypothetical protein
MIYSWIQAKLVQKNEAFIFDLFIQSLHLFGNIGSSDQISANLKANLGYMNM